MEVEVLKRKRVETTDEDGTVSIGYKYRLAITGEDRPTFWTGTFAEDELQPGDLMELNEAISQKTLDEDEDEDESSEDS